jgi:hypothetical protein
MTRQKRAFARAFSGGAFLGILGLISASPARATDANMLLAPSATEDFLPVSSSSRPFVVVRSHDGHSVCMNQVNSGYGWDCSMAGPNNSVTTGPSMTVMPKVYREGGTNIAFKFIFVRNGNNFYEKHLQDQGTEWTDWSTTLLGPPPNGVTPNSALVASHGNSYIAVAFRDTNNTVWIRLGIAELNDGIPFMTNWLQAVKDGSGTTSAPSPACSDAYQTFLALGPANTIRYTPPGPPAYASWANMPNFPQAFNEGVGNITITDQISYPGSWVFMAATHTGNVYYDKIDIYATPPTQFGSVNLGAPAGKAADSAPALALISSAGTEGPLIVVHMNDGHYWTYDKNNNGPWKQMPASQ